MSNYIIVHDPHSSSVLFEDHGFLIDPHKEIDMVTDWHVRDLVRGNETISFPWSRLCCDVERLPSDIAELRGHGIIYTNTLDGRDLRDPPSEAMKAKVLGLYNAHHFRLIDCIEKARSWLPVMIVDAHSYSDIQAALTGRGTQADICIGFNEAEAPQFAMDLFAYFTQHGLSVAFNQPFAGTLKPEQYQDVSSVSSVMIEINKRLYLKNVLRSERDDERFAKLKTILDGAIKVLEGAEIKDAA